MRLAALAALLLSTAPAVSAQGPAEPLLDAASMEQELLLAYLAASQANGDEALGHARAAVREATAGAPGGVGLPVGEASAIVGVAGRHGAQTVAFAGSAGSVLAQAGTATALAALGQECNVAPGASGSLASCTVACPAPVGGSATLGAAPDPCLPDLRPPGAPGVAPVDPGAPAVTLAATPATPFVRGPLHLTAEARNTVQVSSLSITDNGATLEARDYGDMAATRRLEVDATLPEGRHTLQAHASGGVHASSSAAVTLVVDATPPQVQARRANGEPLGAVATLGERIAVAATDPQPAGVDAVSGVARLAWRLVRDGEEPPAFQEVSGVEAHLATGTGVYILEVQVTDAAGNEAEAQAFAFEVVAPEEPVTEPDPAVTVVPVPAPVEAPVPPPVLPPEPVPEPPAPGTSQEDVPFGGEPPVEGVRFTPASSPLPLLAQPWPYAMVLLALSIGAAALLLRRGGAVA